MNDLMERWKASDVCNLSVFAVETEASEATIFLCFLTNGPDGDVDDDNDRLMPMSPRGARELADRLTKAADKAERGQAFVSCADKIQ